MKNAAMEVQELIESPHYLPSISIMLPFEPKMSAKHELQQKLKTVSSEVKKKLTASYSSDMVNPLMEKLKHLISQLDYTTYRKSICIFVSPVKEKLVYLSIPIDEKIVIDESFHVRDIVYNKKEERKFLVLLLSGKTARLYLGDNNKLVRVVCNLPGDISEFENDIPERVSNFSDPSERKENVLKKFLRQCDNSLSLILEAYPLPLFVMGAEKVAAMFKSVSSHSNQVISYIHGNFIEASDASVLSVLQPFIEQWKEVKQKDLLIQIDKAKGNGKLISGILKVWKAALGSNNKLLVVEKNMVYPADRIDEAEIKPHDPATKAFYIQDAVDDVIEKVLNTGGDVEFVENGSLKEYEGIALIRHYATL